MKAVASIAASLAAVLSIVNGASIDYARDVLPILSDKCYHCHGPDEPSRKAKLRLDTKESALRTKDPIIVPGRSSASELVSRITTTNLDDKMPPPDSNRTLTIQQIETLTRWIEEGAKWGQHWAFVPPVRPKVPSTEGSKSQIGNPIDAFIFARLNKEGFDLSQEAARGTWLRRVSFDLTGLPPTLSELNDFLADRSAEAHEKVVDRLLASTRFGERMASDWLDLARFADTHGYQMDRFRPVWPYRDWVIKAFNENLPFDQFVTWQIAGDLLPNATKEQRLATAFNRLHNQNEEGGIVEEEFRVAYVVDRVNTFVTAFLGLTMECTRCHDHKYDPLTQKDYYSLFAFFQNIDESGQTSYFTDSTPVPTLLLSNESQDEKLSKLKARIAVKELELEALRKRAKPEFDRWLKTKKQTLEDIATSSLTNGLIAHYSFDEIFSNRVSNLAGTNFAKGQDNPKLVPGKFGRAVELSGENGFTFGKTGHFNRASPFTLSLWLQTPDHPARSVILHHSKAPIDAGSRGYELLLEDGRVAFGLHHMWPGNSIKVVSRKKITTNEWTQVTVTYDGSSRARGVNIFINSERSNLEVVRDGLWKDITYEGGEPDLALGYRFRDNGFKGGLVDELRIYDRALTAVEVACLQKDEGFKNMTSTLSPAGRGAWFEYFFANIYAPARIAADELHAARNEERKFINPIPEIMAMREMPQPKPAYILKRGAYDAPGERVFANTPAALPAFPANQPTNRLGLAKWLLQPNHPLTARVAVNRFWQMMFGRGLVETSDNFGSQGAQPTHPDLLDWLARDFIESGWDVKRLLKTIALSATYRQSSKANSELLAHDPGNELLARGPARKLTAEMIRDQALATSGLLAGKIGGPSVKPYQPDGLWEIAMGKPRYDQGNGDDLHRRSLYTYWKRTVPPPSMMTFDAADRSYCTARRQSTSTPLQALTMLNDVQFVEAARRISERMLKEGGTTVKERVSWMFLALTDRRATSKELEVLGKLFEEQLAIFTKEPGSAEKLLKVGEAKNDPTVNPAELAAGTVLAQALLSHDEVVMRR